jgi:hypothetical protein
MKEIPLGKSGFFAKVDDADFRWLSQWNWYFGIPRSGKGKPHAYRQIGPAKKRISILMHRLIMGVTNPKVQVDHINGDALDNRRGNLRLCSNQQNNFNKGRRKDNSSGFIGVRWHKRAQKWNARISLDGKEKSLGLYASIFDAIDARDKAVAESHGAFGKLNFN